MNALGNLYIRRGSPEGDLDGCCEVSDWATQEIERLDGELAALRAAQGEPVAWCHGIMWSANPRAQSEQIIKVTRYPQPEHGFTIPIHHQAQAAPVTQPAPAAQAEPLTPDVVREMVEDTRETFDALSSGTPQVVRDVIEYVSSWLGVYLDKRAHGIGGKP